jgi:hypothetical protein
VEGRNQLGLVVWGRRCGERSCVAWVPGVLAKVSEFALGEEIDLNLVDNDARIVYRGRDLKAPEFFAGFVGDRDGFALPRERSTAWRQRLLSKWRNPWLRPGRLCSYRRVGIDTRRRGVKCGRIEDRKLWQTKERTRRSQNRCRDQNGLGRTGQLYGMPHGVPAPGGMRACAHFIAEANVRARNARVDCPGISAQPVEKSGRPSEPLDSYLRNVAAWDQQSQASFPFACSSLADVLPGARFHGISMGSAKWTGCVSPAIVVRSTRAGRPLSGFEPAICPHAQHGALRSAST